MTAILGMAVVLPVDDLAAAVRQWQAVLGSAPTFVDGERWAQFDTAAGRIALAGTDRVSDAAGVMFKTGDIDAARRALADAGLAPGAIEQGPHERRVTAAGPGGAAITFYDPAAR